jgi:Putative Ig domain
MLGSLLQVNQQLTPITYWQDWLTNTLNYSPPGSINCENNLCPAQDGTDYLSGHGPYSSNADAGHRAVGPTQQHALERRGEFVTPFNWGGVAIYIELKSTPLALGCPSSSAQVGVPYASPMVTTGGEPDYSYTITSAPGLPPGLQQLGLSNPYIYGLPTMAGKYPYTAQVTDAAKKQTTANCSITVSPQ